MFKPGKIIVLREKLINKGRYKAAVHFRKELARIVKQHNVAMASLEKEHRQGMRQLSNQHRSTIKTIEKNHQQELKQFQAQTEKLNARLNKKIEDLDRALEIRDAEIGKLKSLTQQALAEEARRALIGERVLKEASLLKKTELELQHLQDEADYVIKKTDKKLQLVR